jgi:hypothetical protein
VTPAERQRALEALYALIPEVPCKRLCQDSCSFIGTMRAERERMQAGGVTPPRIQEAPCRHLMFNGDCGVRELRPVICRLYGATEELACPFGCKSDPQLTKDEAYAIMLAVDQLLPFPSQGDTTMPRRHKHPLETIRRGG